MTDYPLYGLDVTPSWFYSLALLQLWRWKGKAAEEHVRLLFFAHCGRAHVPRENVCVICNLRDEALETLFQHCRTAAGQIRAPNRSFEEGIATEEDPLFLFQEANVPSCVSLRQRVSEGERK